MPRNRIRIPIKIEVIEDGTGKTVQTSSSRLKTKAIAISTELLAKYDVSKHTFLATITYSKKNDSYNQFYFLSLAQLKERLDVDLEDQLLKELYKDGMLDEDCVPKGF